MPGQSILERLSACLEVSFAKDEMKLHVLETDSELDRTDWQIKG